MSARLLMDHLSMMRFMQRDFSKQLLFERFRRGHCLNKFDDVEKVECLEVRLSQESIH